MDLVRDPGSYVGTYIVLGGSLAFFPFLFAIYAVWTQIYKFGVRLTCRRELSYNWEARMGVDFAGIFDPISVRRIRTTFCPWMPLFLVLSDLNHSHLVVLTIKYPFFAVYVVLCAFQLVHIS